MNRFLVVVAFSLAVLASVAQKPPQRFYVELSGIVTDHFTGDPIKGVLIRLLKAGKLETEMVTHGDGKYLFGLDRGWRYSVWYSCEGRLTKHVDINTEEIPAYPDVPYYEMDVQMTLFLWIEDFDFSVFDQPVGEASYKYSVRNVSWDVDYTESIRPRLSRTMQEYEKAYKGYYKRQAGRRPAKQTFGRPDAADSTLVPGLEPLRPDP